jgi:hypothetical protein
MPNVGNKLVRDVFISPEGDDTEYIPNDAVTFNNAMANNDNDCPYAVFPIFGGYSALSGNEKQKGKQLMDNLLSLGVVSNKIAAAGIVGNLRQECGSEFDYKNAVVDSDGYIAGGICMWNDRYGNLTHLLELNPNGYGQAPIRRISTTLGISGVKNRLSELTLENQLDFLKKTMGSTTKQKLENAATPEDAAEVFRARYEVGSGANARMNFARQFYNAYDNTQTVTDQNELAKMNEEIYELFFSAINKTAQNTESMKFELKNSYYPNKNDSNKVMMVSAANSQNNAKLAKLFDCILNTPEYFRYVNKLYWVYDNMVSNLIRVDIKLSSKDVPTNQQRVFFYATGSRDDNGNASRINVNVNDLSDDCKKSLKKRYDLDGEKKLKCLVPELADPENLSEIDISDCASVGNDIIAIGSEISKGDAGSIDGWDVGKACATLIRRAKPKYIKGQCGHCAAYVEDAIAAGGGPLAKRMNCGDGKYATNLRYRGILKENGFVMIDSGIAKPYGDAKIPLQSGDVAIIGKDALTEGGKYHACMFSSQGWISDFKQKHMSPYDSSWPYAIYRFHNKQKA